MPLTATLALDISNFQAGLATAQSRLDGFAQKTVRNTSRDLSRLLEDFTGQKIVAEAARMSEAVERIGGAAQLTEREQRRVNAAVTEAIAKYQALGQEAPPHLVRLQQETARVDTSAGALTGTIGRMAAAFSVASLIDKGASALFAFGAEALTSAGNLVDLRNATQVSLGTLQQWTHVGKLAGVQLDLITTNAFKASAAIDGGGASVRQGVARLNLEWERLRSLSPEDQMKAILTAADALGPSQQRNTALVEIFGQRAALELAKVSSGYRDAAAEATVSADAQVEALDAAGDAWDRLQGKIANNVMLAGGTLAQWVLDSKAAFDLLGADMSRFTDTQRRMIQELQNSGGEGLDAYLQRIASARKEDIQLAGQGAAAQSSYIAALAAVKGELGQLTPATKAELNAALQLHGVTEQLATQFGLSEAALKLYRSEATEAAKAKDRLAQSISWVDGEIDPLTKLMIEGAIPALGQFATETDVAEDAMLDLQIALARANGTLVSFHSDLASSPLVTPGMWEPLKRGVQDSGAATRSFFQRFKDDMADAGMGASGLSNLFAQAFTGGGGALGALQAFATQGLSTLLGMIPGVGQWAQAFAGPIVAMLSKLKDKFASVFGPLFGGPSASEQEGRGLVAEFEQTLHASLTAKQLAEAAVGGTQDWEKTVIALRDAYIAAGRTEEEALADAKRLWESSQKGAEESKKVIEQIEAKLKGLPTEHTIDVTTRYHSEGTPPGGPVNTGGPVDPGGGFPRVNATSAGAASDRPIVVNTYLDGRQVAMATVPHHAYARRMWGV